MKRTGAVRKGVPAKSLRSKLALEHSCGPDKKGRKVNITDQARLNDVLGNVLKPFNFYATKYHFKTTYHTNTTQCTRVVCVSTPKSKSQCFVHSFRLQRCPYTPSFGSFRWT